MHSLGRSGLGCRYFVQAVHERERDQPLERPRNRRAQLQRDGGQPWALAQGKALGQRHSPAHRDVLCSPPICAFSAKCPVQSGKIYLFPEKCRHNLKPQLIKDCCGLLANRKRGREKDTISQKQTCCELALISLTMMDALPQWLSSVS